MYQLLSWLLLAMFLMTTADPQVRVNHFKRLRRRNLKRKLVGGHITTADHVKYQASVRAVHTHICGGSLISEKHVLTAAHCKISNNLLMFNIVLGATYTKGDGSPINIIKFIKYPGNGLVESNVENIADIALIQLEWPVKFSDKIGPIALPEPGIRLAEGQPLNISGYGDTHIQMIDMLMPFIEHRHITNMSFLAEVRQLRLDTVKVVAELQCHEMYRAVDMIDNDNVFCITNPNVETCQGDSGGGVVMADTLIGIVSIGIACVGENYPAICTNVASYLAWIHDEMATK